MIDSGTSDNKKPQVNLEVTRKWDGARQKTVRTGETKADSSRVGFRIAELTNAEKTSYRMSIFV